MKNNKTKQSEHPNRGKNQHLEEAFFNNPVASSNDRTGYVNTPPASHEEAEDLSKLLNVPVSPLSKERNEHDSG